MGTNPSTAITPYQQFKGLMLSPETQDMLEVALGKGTRTFIAAALNTVNSSKELSKCDPHLLLKELMKAAVLRLSIDPNIGQAWIIPYKDHGVPVPQFQIGYKGIVELARRTNEYEIINYSIIPEGIEVQVDILTGEVKIVGTKKSDRASGYTSYFRLKSGLTKALFMTREQVIAHAKQYSKSFNSQYSAWATDFDKMALKTVLKQIITKWGPMTLELQDVLTSDDKTPEEQLANELMSDADIIDGTSRDVTEEEAEQPHAPEAQPEYAGNPDPAPAAEKKPERPFAPADLKQKLADIAAKIAETKTKCSEAKVVEICNRIGELLDDPGSEKRVQVFKYWFGSSKPTDAQYLAVNKWLDNSAGFAMKEIEASYDAALFPEGQATLL